MDSVASKDLQLWSTSSALAVLAFIAIIFLIFFYFISSGLNVNEVARNWAKYRCDPSIMPFASFYGHNTADNFNYCLGNIFSKHSMPITSSFSKILGGFTGVMSTLMGSITSLRTTAATMGGGINVIFQDFTDRITQFFFLLRMSAIRMKTLYQRMYAILFSVMYMGMSGITAMESFSNTVLFSFLNDIGCFPPATDIVIRGRGRIMIKDVKIGDVIDETGSRVTGFFKFNGFGQNMVYFKRKDNPNMPLFVSNNHYIYNNGSWIRSDEHPDGNDGGKWGTDELICLNTSDHTIYIGGHLFRDYDETEAADKQTMTMIENMVNRTNISDKEYVFKEYASGAIHGDNLIRMKDGTLKPIKDITLYDKIESGDAVYSIIQRQITEYCEVPYKISASTLVWDKEANVWFRAGDRFEIKKYEKPEVYYSMIVYHSSQIELENGMRIRDYMEIHSPVTEMYYSEQLKDLTN